TLIGASAPAARHQAGTFCGIANDELLGRRSLTETACLALLAREGEPADLFVFQTLIGLLLSNGPGTISAQGAKGAVAADGPGTRDGLRLNRGVAGWLSNSGFAHGGTGYEGIASLVEQFAGTGLTTPASPAHGIDLDALAAKCAAAYAKYKTDRKSAGSLEIQKIPGVNHPVFKDKPINYDPREVFVHDLFTQPAEHTL